MTTSRADVTLPGTTLIICSRNRPALLWETVQSILAGERLPAEIVIVDQSGAPNHALAERRTARGCELRYGWSRAVGIGRARNEGIAAARYPMLAFSDDDMLAPPTWFAALIGALRENGPRGVVTGRVLAAPDVPAGQFVPSTVVGERPACYSGRIGRDVLASGNMAIYRSAIDDVGGFDERLGPGTPFPAAEDNDLGFRLLERGYRIIYAPQALLYHRAWRSTREYLPMRWRYGRGQGAYYAKHLSLRDRYMLRRLAFSAYGHIMQSIRLARRQRPQAYAHAVYVLGLLAGATQWLLTRRRSS